MDGDIETTLVSVVKEEEIEIKEEPIDDYGQQNREERFGVLGNFYQVECNAGPLEGMVEEELHQKTVKGCACSKDLERLESRMGRLECLLELLVSKVAASRNLGSSTVTPTAATTHATTSAATPSITPSAMSSATSPTKLSAIPAATSILKENGQSSAACDNAAGSSKTTVSLPSIKLAANLCSKSEDQSSSEQQKENPTVVAKKVVFTSLVIAAQFGDLRAVESLLKYNPPLKEAGEALQMASSPSVVKRLFQAYPELVQGPLGVRALLFAAERGRWSVLRTLLDAGVNPNSVNRTTMTALHKAAAKGHLDCVQLLLQRGADVSAITSSRWSALHLAAMNGATSCMEALVKAGADIEAVEEGGCTPLHYAARWNQVAAVIWLLNKGACSSATNRRGKTPLHLAGTSEILKLLKLQSQIECPQTVDSEDEVPLYKRLKE